VELPKGIETPIVDGGPKEGGWEVEGDVVKGGRLALTDGWVGSGDSLPTGDRVGIGSLPTGIEEGGQPTPNRRHRLPVVLRGSC